MLYSASSHGLCFVADGRETSALLPDLRVATTSDFGLGFDDQLRSAHVAHHSRGLLEPRGSDRERVRRRFDGQVSTDIRAPSQALRRSSGQMSDETRAQSQALRGSS